MRSSAVQFLIKVTGAIVLVVASFWITLRVLDYSNSVRRQTDTGAVRQTPGAPQPMTADVARQCANLPLSAGVVTDTSPAAAGAHVIVGNGVQPAAVAASSVNKPQENPENIFDDNDQSYWHRSVEKNLPEEWLSIDLGALRGVNELASRPRLDQVPQFFKSACFLGSKDNVSWQGITRLAVPPLSELQWVDWKLGVPVMFRYYRLFFANAPAFYSIGKLQLAGL